MTDILSMTPKELESDLALLGEPTYRARQIFGWLHKRKASSFSEMTDLSISLRLVLEERYTISNAKILKTQNSFKDKTQKYLLEFANDTIIECVLMTYEYGNTLCVSSQDGCRMGCAFCASGIDGLNRNLTAGEIISQIYEVERSSGEKVSRCVIMGQGEPFDNFDNTILFLNIINSKEGRNMSLRNITVSTSGIVPKIIEFANMKTQANLAVSLHGPNDEIRSQIMKISKAYDYNSLLDACTYYTKTTNRRITFEYALIKGINDEKGHAFELAKKLKGLLCHVNLIPLNEVTELPYKGSASTEVFASILQRSGINVTIRRKLGSEIEGACGQLGRIHRQ